MSAIFSDLPPYYIPGPRDSASTAGRIAFETTVKARKIIELAPRALTVPSGRENRNPAVPQCAL